MIHWGVILGFISALILVSIILLISLPGLNKFADDETQKNLLGEIEDDKKSMCGISDKLGMIFDSVDVISSEKFDNRAKGIYQQMQWGVDVESCDIVYFYDQLSFEQKKKLNWLDFSCNVPQCLSD